ncbi:msb1l [Haematobia irritans]|uniref:msb1l n=1 Tax=Haematobia irritans TaxID=7368 RepID=UPI003F507A9E
MGTKPSKTQFEKTDNIVAMDPRSPGGCRTPILVPIAQDQTHQYPNALEGLRKRFLKGFTYNINDPRSPSLNLNRTPLMFEDSRQLNLDDTFANLFAGPNLPCDDIDMSEDVKPVENETPIVPPMSPQQKIDPRSPSIGIERTPIIFNDDDGSDDNLLENILSTLSLNLNESTNSTSIVSISSPDLHAPFTEKEDFTRRPTNRSLERVRFGKKAPSKGLHRKQKRILRQRIYEDSENQPVTPHTKSINANINSPRNTRTPLSCIRNSSQARSRSVENTVQSIQSKARLTLMSFDDTLNPKENPNVCNINAVVDKSPNALVL